MTALNTTSSSSHLPGRRRRLAPVHRGRNSLLTPINQNGYRYHHRSDTHAFTSLPSTMSHGTMDGARAEKNVTIMADRRTEEDNPASHDRQVKGKPRFITLSTNSNDMHTSMSHTAVKSYRVPPGNYQSSGYVRCPNGTEVFLPHSSNNSLQEPEVRTVRAHSHC